MGNSVSCSFFHLLSYIVCLWLIQPLGLSQNTSCSYPSCCYFSSFAIVARLRTQAVEISESGTNVTIKTTCHNDKCKKASTWHSQPFLPGSLIHAGNFLLPLAVVLAGGSAAKVVRIFKHMAVGCVSLKTFFRHQRVSALNTLRFAGIAI